MEIDTTTTAGKIAVMQAFEDGKVIESRMKPLPDNWTVAKPPVWNWMSMDYRIKPEPREWWVCFYDEQDVSDGGRTWIAPATADGMPPGGWAKVIRVREILP